MKGKKLILNQDSGTGDGIDVSMVSVASSWSNIMKITVPAGLAYVLLNDTPFVFMLRAVGDAQLARAGKMIIGFKASGDNLVKELYRWDCGIFYDLTAVEQRNKQYRDQVALHMSWPYVIAREDESFLIQLYHGTVCDPDAASSIIEFPVQKVLLSS